MKIKSKLKENVYFEKWETPLCRARHIWLVSFLQTGNRIHLFFSLEDKASSEIHVMTVSRLCPYRMTDQSHAIRLIANNLVPARIISSNRTKNKESFLFKTWKLWGTNFINEVNENSALSGYKNENDENIFQYLIQTQNEWIEFICALNPKWGPQWKMYKNKKLHSLLLYYVSKTRDR